MLPLLIIKGHSMKKSKLAASLVPYVPGEQPKTKVIKLNTNENPYPPSPKAREVLANYDVSRLRLYPDPTADVLRTALAEAEGTSIEKIFVGNGSDEVLSFAFAAYFDADSAPVLFADVTYSFYKVYCELYGINYQTIPLDDSFKINIDDYLGKNVSGIVIANPNAPTAISLDESEIVRLIESYPDNVVILDEAYVDFSSRKSLVGLTDKYDNLIVVKTFSKSRNLAGGRCGYAVACKNLIDTIRTVKNCFNSYTINSMTALVATEVVKDKAYFAECVSKIKATRAKTIAELSAMGFEITESDANFIFARYPYLSGEELQKKLRESDIVVRRFDSPRIKDWLRITIGTDAEMESLIKECKKIIQK